MNWVGVAFIAWVILGLQFGAADPLAIGGAIAPDFVLPFVLFLGLKARRSHARWAALLLGVIVDLQTGVMLTTDATATIAGPNALGLLIAAELAIAARDVVIERNPFTLLALAFVGGLAMHAFITLMLGVRSLYDPIAFNLVDQLALRFWTILYTAAISLPMSLLLFVSAPLMGLADDDRW